VLRNQGSAQFLPKLTDFSITASNFLEAIAVDLFRARRENHSFSSLEHHELPRIQPPDLKQGDFVRRGPVHGPKKVTVEASSIDELGVQRDNAAGEFLPNLLQPLPDATPPAG